MIVVFSMDVCLYSHVARTEIERDELRGPYLCFVRERKTEYDSSEESHSGFFL